MARVSEPLNRLGHETELEEAAHPHSTAPTATRPILIGQGLGALRPEKKILEE